MKPATRISTVLTLVVGLGACSSGGADERAGARVIVLISLDTLRADHLSLYGYERRTSPELEELAAGATVYRRARSPAPWTLPSHASLFTGLYPFEHGARTWELDRFGPEGDSNVSSLPQDFTTLAEALRDGGYATGAVVANLAYMDERFGVAQGFDHYDQARGRVDVINRRALEWIDSVGERPLFLFLNYTDTHRPYNCTPREGAEFPSSEEAGNVVKRLLPLVLDLENEAPAELLEAAVNQYDTAIANLDEGLGELFQALRERGLWDDALIVVTSDHGEFLGEHRLIEHSKDVYEEVLRVPLIVKEPRQTEGRTDDEWISLVHVPRIVLEHSKVDPERPGLEALGSHWPRAGVFAENHYARMKDLRAPWGGRFDRVRRVVYDGDWKYIDSSDGEHELYDLAEDPAEGSDLSEERRADVERLAARVRDWIGSRQAVTEPLPVPTDAAHRRHLETMGYAGDDEDEDD